MADLKSLSEEIADLMALRPGEEFALFAWNSGWSAEFVNETDCVMLGEVRGQFRGRGDTPEEAVRNCANAARAWRPPTKRETQAKVVGQTFAATLTDEQLDDFVRRLEACDMEA